MMRSILHLLSLFILVAFGGCDDSTAPGSEPVADASVKDDGSLADASQLDAGEGEQGRLLLNEVMAAPGDGESDWIEFIAMGPGAVSTAGYTVVDDNPDHVPAALPEMTLEAGEFLVVMASRDAPEDTDAVAFQLGGSDGLTLARGGETVDTLSWSDGQAPSGATYGRLPDGTGEAQTTTPTPGAVNQAYGGPPPALDPFAQGRVIEVRLELPAEDWESILDRPLDETYYEGNMIYDGASMERVAIRVKGNSSLQSVARRNGDRFSFKVDMNRYVDGQDFSGHTKLNFNNGYHDPSMMREHLAYEISRDLGLPAARTAFVDLWLNAEHMGLYTVVEHVDGNFLDTWFGDDEGLLYKPSIQAGSLRYRGDTIDRYNGVDPQRGGEDADHGAFIALVAALDGRAAAPPLEEIIDVDGALRYLASTVGLSTLDSYIGSGHNYYLYVLDGRFTVIPWDFNGAFGIFNCNCDRAGVIGFRIDEPVCWDLRDRPLVERLMENDDWRETYHGYLRELLDGPLDPDVMEARVEGIATLIEPYVEADERSFYSPAEFRDNLHNDHVEMDGRVLPGLVSFARDRSASMRAQMAGETASTNDGMGNCERRRPMNPPGNP